VAEALLRTPLGELQHSQRPRPVAGFSGRIAAGEEKEEEKEDKE